MNVAVKYGLSVIIIFTKFYLNFKRIAYKSSNKKYTLVLN